MLSKLKNIFTKKLNRTMEKNDIDMYQLKNMVSKGATLVDVRSPQEYNEGHLENSILIPEYELTRKSKKELPNKEKTIIVYCSTGTRSKRAQKQLEKSKQEKARKTKSKSVPGEITNLLSFKKRSAYA